MYLSISNPGHTLTSAYDLQRRTPDNAIFEKPKATTRKGASRPGVVYDASRKLERVKVLSTPAQGVAATQTRASRYTSNQRVSDLMQAGAIIGAAESLGVGFAAWARFAYNETKNQETAAAMIWLQKRMVTTWYFCNQRKSNLTNKAIQDLAGICLIDTRSRTANGKPAFSVEQVCKMLGYRSANNANWYRTIKPHYDQFARMLDFLNARVMASVHKKTRELVTD